MQPMLPHPSPFSVKKDTILQETSLVSQLKLVINYTCYKTFTTEVK